ncbi:septation protein IspZ [Sphingosinithalassobacter tenebrarum]|uniref:Inner membrane-spanning protein YciB n=2 Tax=Stakelama tenebrarum TaxID=2711215 RepID=A0A6G6YB25_9SPHN|nr:septation protein IspZ [Sphingosinithalassobacter tenebrarum]
MRMLIDFGPLIVFFAVNALYPAESELQKALAATAAFMVTMAAAMALSFWKAGRISPMLWISGGLVLVFGSLTIYFHDEVFIQIKPTLVYAMFAAILFYGLVAKKPLLQMLLESAYPGLTARGWRLLTVNWAVFFVAMAVLNEVARYFLSWDGWVAYKTWGVIPMTFVFALANIPMLMKHGLQTEKDAPLPPEG